MFKGHLRRGQRWQYQRPLPTGKIEGELRLRVGSCGFTGRLDKQSDPARVEEIVLRQRRDTLERGRHGTQAHYEVMAEILGEVCGVLFSHPDEKTIYLAGDTIWNEDVAAVLSAHVPEVAILNAGYAMVQGVDGSIIMGTEDVLRVHQAAPEALLIASHMEAINHCVLTRAELRAFAAEEGFSDNLLTPGDGDTYTI